MSNDYGNDFVTITDDDGNEYELEHLDTADIDGELYMAFVPADLDEDDEDFGLIVLKVSIQDEEEIFVTIEDDNELDYVYEFFLQRFSEDDDGDYQYLDEDDD